MTLILIPMQEMDLSKDYYVIIKYAPETVCHRCTAGSESGCSFVGVCGRITVFACKKCVSAFLSNRHMYTCLLKHLVTNLLHCDFLSPYLSHSRQSLCIAMGLKFVVRDIGRWVFTSQPAPPAMAQMSRLRGPSVSSVPQRNHTGMDE